MNPEAPQQPIDQPAQPTPVVTPPTTPPANEAAPIAPTPAPAPAPKKTKKIILLASIIGGVILLAVIAVIVYFSMTSVSKEDYADAARQFNEVTRAASDLTSDMASLNSNIDASEDVFNEDVAAVEETVSKIKAEHEELGKLKAVRVGEGGKLYDTFDKKLDTYLTFGDQIITSVKNVQPALLVCSEVRETTTNEARTTAIKACATSLGKVKDIPSPEFKTYITSLQKGYEDFAAAYEAVNDIQNPFGSGYEEYQEQRDKISDIQQKIRDANETFADAMTQKEEELSVDASSEALSNYLNDQQRK